MSFVQSMGKSLSSKYGQRILRSTKKSTTEAMKTTSNRVINRIAEATGDLIGNKTADKITSASRKSNKKLSNNEAKEEDVEIIAHKKKVTYLQKKDN